MLRSRSGVDRVLPRGDIDVSYVIEVKEIMHDRLYLDRSDCQTVLERPSVSRQQIYMASSTRVDIWANAESPNGVVP